MSDTIRVYVDRDEDFPVYRLVPGDAPYWMEAYRSFDCPSELYEHFKKADEQWTAIQEEFSKFMKDAEAAWAAVPENVKAHEEDCKRAREAWRK